MVLVNKFDLLYRLKKWRYTSI